MKYEYDINGRMKYNPEFHRKHNTSWSKEDLEYLICWYDLAGPEELSFALERPMTAINQKVVSLRKKGIMKKSEKRMYHKTIRRQER